MPDDFSELNELARDLGTVASNAGPRVRRAIDITSQRIKRDWQEPLKGSVTLPGLPYAITYDVTVFQGFGVTVIQSEIGFDKARNQGPLGNISEYGSPTIGPRGYGLAALQKNEADLDKGLSVALAQAEAALTGSIIPGGVG